MANMRWFSAVFVGLLAVTAALLLYSDDLDPAPYPDHELTPHGSPLFIPTRNTNMLQGSDKIGRVTLNDSAAHSVVEKWVNTGGRPLGIAHGLHDEVIVADAYKGLLNISKEGVVELLTDEADGLKFKLTDAVDVGDDGVLYFTDASYTHDYKESIQIVLDGRPHGRLMSYDPSTKQTKVLLKDLFLANGVALSPDQSFVIVCETPMRRCKRYYIKGPRKGSLDIFIDNLPGFPDNIRYDGEGQYWIALNTNGSHWDMLLRRRFLRKLAAVWLRHRGWPHIESNAGIVAVDLDGKPTAHYYDRHASFITSGINLSQYPATPAS